MEYQESSKNNKKALGYALCLFFGLIVMEMTAILIINNGHFMFSLDDPYIHLALAENILQGHYGVNADQYSAPSSSILWPLVIAPFTLSLSADILVFLLNCCCGASALVFFSKILLQINVEQQHLTFVKQLVLLVIFMLAGNLVGLIYIGMEHSLQVLLAAIIAWGLIETMQTNKAPALLWIAIVVSPLVRYESLIISAVALVFLFLNKQYVKSIVSGFVIVILLTLFSVFLLSLQLGYLPDSILAKSDVAASGMDKTFGNIVKSFKPPNTFKAIGMMILAIYLFVWGMFFTENKNKSFLCGLASYALAMHFIGGRIGWYFRYEMYVWIFALSIFTYVYFSNEKFPQRKIFSLVGNATRSFIVLVIFFEGIVAALTTPLASSNIYHQQYQIHRLITEFYKKPVAVNDLGWSSYQNQYEVLDLWGLGSTEARVLRKNGANADWMDRLVKRDNVELIMIYNNKAWFSEVPNNWIKVGELDIAGPKITSWFAVSLYSQSQESVAEIKSTLQSFSKTLPEGSVLSIQ